MRCLSIVAALACLLATAVPAGAEPDLPPGTSLPVLRSAIPAGGGTTVALADRPGGAITIDGDRGDWLGELPGFGGAAMYSRGELVYQDHLFDAYGPAKDDDVQRVGIFDQGTSFVPQLYRVDATLLQYAPGELGVPVPEPLAAQTNHGALAHQDEADLSEVRLATNAQGELLLLARTTTMKDSPAGILVLLDTAAGDTPREVPFASGLTTTAAEHAALITPAGGTLVDLADGSRTAFPAAYDATGYENVVEARLPITASRVAVAAGATTGSGDLANVANVAFRFDEPAQEWWDKKQALALHGGSIDAFFTALDLDRMRAGASERYVPGPGYHEAIFTSTPDISEESDDRGLLQRYGVYLPTNYDEGRATPTQFWLHFRGGTAHVAAHVVPGVFWDMGEARDSIVITPHGRGTSGWYVGKSAVDIEQVWADSHERFSIDRDRTYVAGHSMGGYGSWLLPIMHPDWFAGAFPASPPVTQGAWTGLDFEGCEDYQFEDASPCFVQANGGDARAQWLTPLIDNLREVPYAIYHGAQDELVPASGVTLHTKRFQDLGYRFRYYLFHGQEHYGPPAVDQWAEGADYLHRFVRNPNPARVTYVRSMPFENAIERVNAPASGPVELDLDSAYWMSGLRPADPADGIARFDGTSLALPRVPHTTYPEADAGGRAGNVSPYTMAGQAWKADPAATPPTANAFEITLTGATAVTLDLQRMRLSLDEPLQGAVTTDTALTLTLVGAGGDRRTIEVAPGTTSLEL